MWPPCTLPTVPSAPTPTGARPSSDAPLGQRAGGAVARLRGPYLALVAVAVAQALVELVAMPLTRGINWDEAVYLTQVAVGEPAVFFDAHRARGLSLLLAPVAVFDPPFLLVRLWAIALGASGVVVAFRPWVRRLGYGAVWGAAIFAFGWVSLYFAGEIYPNYPVAVAIVAAGGWLLAHLEEGDRGPLVAASLAVMAAALIRPVDAAVGGVGLVLAAFLLHPRRALRPTVAMGVAGFVGIVPWILEGMVRFGAGPLGPIGAAQENTTGGPVVNQLPLYLRNLEGPIRCVNDCRATFLADPMWYLPPPRSGGMLVVMGLLAFLALTYRFRERRATRLLWLAPIAGGAMMTFYATCGCAVNLRYVLPVWGFLALPVGAGLGIAWSLAEGRWRPVSRVLIGVLVLLWGGWQVSHAVAEMESNIRSRDRARTIAAVLDERAAGEPCAAAVQYSYPQIQYYSSCLTLPLYRGSRGWLQAPVGTPTGPHDLAELAEQGYRIFAVNKSGLPANSPVREWLHEDISSDVLGAYDLYTLPDDARLGDAEVPGTSAGDDG